MQRPSDPFYCSCAFTALDISILRPKVVIRYNLLPSLRVFMMMRMINLHSVILFTTVLILILIFIQCIRQSSTGCICVRQSDVFSYIPNWAQKKMPTCESRRRIYFAIFLLVLVESTIPVLDSNCLHAHKVFTKSEKDQNQPLWLGVFCFCIFLKLLQSKYAAPLRRVFILS